GREEEWRGFPFSSFLLFLSVCLFCFGLIFKRKYSFGWHCRGKGRIWRDWELSGIEVHDVKFPKSQ
ncbi:hypothetical protein ACQP3J_31855, partial [Escherichia coli]